MRINVITGEEGELGWETPSQVFNSSFCQIQNTEYIQNLYPINQKTFPRPSWSPSQLWVRGYGGCDPYSWAPCGTGWDCVTSCKGLLPILGRSNSSKSATICKSGEELCLEVASEASQKEQGLKQCLDCSVMLGLLRTGTELGITL